VLATYQYDDLHMGYIERRYQLHTGVLGVKTVNDYADKRIESLMRKQNKDYWLHIRVTKKEHQDIIRKAKKLGLDVSPYARMVLKSAPKISYRK